MNKFIFILSILIVNQVFAKCDTAEILIIDDPKDVVEVDPSTLRLSFYDEKLNEANVKGYKAFSKNGGNLGIGAIEIEQLIFDLVDDENTSALNANIEPFGKMIVSDIYDEDVKYLLDKRVLVGGENLVDAKGSFDQTEGHAVSFRFDTEGAQKFGKVTSTNVGSRLAVVLDGVVITAPRINGAITGGSGIITGNFKISHGTNYVRTFARCWNDFRFSLFNE